ncbi:COP9 signalosome complex subunit 6-like protein [Syncephalis fuscata]|nr:COP9 signalosome complex subunit 6-like protein [Syncephalis fuscata]
MEASRMDVDTNTSLLSSNLSSSGLQVTLHPLALLNMSDHYTRTQMQYTNKDRLVIGALYGTQNGREISIHTTYELLCIKNSEGKQTIDSEYYLTKAEQMKQVFPDFDVLGWYLVATDELSSQDLDIHQRMQEYNENPLYLRLDPKKVNLTTGTLPATIYDTETEMQANGEWITQFCMMPYTLETGEAERIAVDHVAKLGTQGNAIPGEQESALISQLTNQRGAVQMLRDRVGLLRDYVKAVQKGELEEDTHFLREIAGLCQQMPIVQLGDSWNKEYNKESEDALLVAHLSTLTKAIHNLHELVVKRNAVVERRSDTRI